jgi:hypothetical protein
MLGDFRANGFGSEQERLSSWGFHYVAGVLQVGETEIPFDTSKGTHRETLSRISGTETKQKQKSQASSGVRASMASA